MPSVLSISFPANFTEFTKAFDFINADFLSVTGATCVDGVNFMTRFSTMSLLPLFALLMFKMILRLLRDQLLYPTNQKGNTTHVFLSAVCSFCLAISLQGSRLNFLFAPLNMSARTFSGGIVWQTKTLPVNMYSVHRTSDYTRHPPRYQTQ